MDQTILQKRIEKKAKVRFEKEFHAAVKAIRDNQILVSLTIGKLELGSGAGYCPATTLFTSADRALIRKETNFDELEKRLIDKYSEEETDNLLRTIAQVVDFIQENQT